jgi:hypothetical protein
LSLDRRRQGQVSSTRLELAEFDGRAGIEIVEAVAAGDNVAQRGATATIGATLVPAGTRLAARHIGLLTITGLSRVPVVRRPRSASDDTVGATERAPMASALNGEILTPARCRSLLLHPVPATGGMVPRGADAVIMVEHTETRDDGGST